MDPNYPMLKRLTSVLAGCSAGIALIFLTESIGHVLFPMPAIIDPTNKEAIKELMANVPIAALLIVLLGAFLGGFSGGFVAAKFDANNARRNALIVGAILTLLGILNLIMIPHPAWFMAIDCVIYLSGAYLGSLLIKPKQHA